MDSIDLFLNNYHKNPTKLFNIDGIKRNFKKYQQTKDLALKPIYEDNELLIKISEGDQHAFSYLFNQHQSRLFTFALNITRNRELSQEVIQDVFLNVWINREKLPGLENFGGYINRTTRNISLNALRKIAKDKVLVNDFGDDENYPDHSTEELLNYKDRLATVQKAVDKLPKQQRLVYQLCQQEGLTYEQAAVELSIAPATVHSHLKAAMKSIRAYLVKMEIPMVIIVLLFR